MFEIDYLMNTKVVREVSVVYAKREKQANNHPASAAKRLKIMTIKQDACLGYCTGERVR